MSALLNIYFKKDVLEKIIKTLDAKNENGIGITVSINDETNQYGQNCSAWVSQTKEQREAKNERFFVGNGGVNYISESGIKKAVKVEKADQTPNQPLQNSDNDDLPF